MDFHLLVRDVNTWKTSFSYGYPYKYINIWQQSCISIIQSRQSIIQNHCIHNWIMDIHNLQLSVRNVDAWKAKSVVGIHNSVMDIHNLKFTIMSIIQSWLSIIQNHPGMVYLTVFKNTGSTHNRQKSVRNVDVWIAKIDWLWISMIEFDIQNS